MSLVNTETGELLARIELEQVGGMSDIAELAAAAMADESASVIYFIRNPHSGAIKIGRTSNLAARVGQLRTALPDLQLIGYLPGGARAESELHASFADERTAGEWFRPSTRLVAAIASLLTTSGAVTA